VSLLSIGYLVSCSTDQVSMALSLVPVCLVPITLFGGYFLNIESVITFVQKYHNFFSRVVVAQRFGSC